jgi:RHS repeat-associated protein
MNLHLSPRSGQPPLPHNHARYNAESEIESAAGVGYTYDGDGNRLDKCTLSGSQCQTVTKLYWYGAGTEILDESDGSGNFTNEYVFFGGKRVAMRNVSSGTIYYYAEDMLGSSRTIVQAGQTTPCYDADFYPFGGERIVTNSCTQTQNYKFEGKERDTETGNDDFGARYYNSRLGRWLSADWSSVPVPVPYANLTNPQTLNLYAMVSDNPETFADLDGHEGGLCGEAMNACPDNANGTAGTTPKNIIKHHSPTQKAQGDSANQQAQAQQQKTSTTSKIIKKVKAGALAVKKAYAAEQKWVKDHPEVVAAAAILGAVLGGGEGEPEPEGEVPGEVGAPEEGAAPSAGEVNVSFGHGARHLEGTGLSPDAVEAAIRGQVQGATSGASAVGNFWGRVNVGGQTIEFRAYPLPNGTINVGTYYPIVP